MKIGLMWVSAGIMLAFPMFSANAQQATTSGDLVIERAWTRTTDADNRSAAIYFTLRNVGQATVDLIGMRADRASIEELHKTEFDTTGTARMSAAPELRVAPGETFKLEPGGMHVMLIDVESPLVEGETLPLRLKFYDGDDIIVDVPILAADARGPQE
ncbi:copper chaperone PCu(A)C [Rhodobacteraceae bacterium R_SAG3]|uniref:copper chaperone PCu(A)C n=1 Tax=Tritonibacter mobilis TaxID=379347 RepID=UPI000806C19B|nr:copper chaperone PCu(A)C [Tritonibacter mobilis]NKX75735.1 copper chaperone PCu(A)C [Rhodobacteraceae bacterium R_SAG3]